MFSLKNVLIFFGGAEFFHTLSHILLPFFVELPLKTNGYLSHLPLSQLCGRSSSMPSLH